MFFHALTYSSQVHVYVGLCRLTKHWKLTNSLQTKGYHALIGAVALRHLIQISVHSPSVDKSHTNSFVQKPHVKMSASWCQKSIALATFQSLGGLNLRDRGVPSRHPFTPQPLQLPPKKMQFIPNMCHGLSWVVIAANVHHIAKTSYGCPSDRKITCMFPPPQKKKNSLA